MNAAHEHPIEVTRRDGESLVLMSSSEADARDHLLELAAQFLAAATDDSAPLSDRLADRFDWMLALADDDRTRCADDLVRAARASFSTGQAHLAVAELNAWRETAIAVAAGLGRTDLTWYDADETVPRP